MITDEMIPLNKYRYCFLAGTFAAGGSFFGKLPSYLAAKQLLAVSSDTQLGYIKFLLTQALPILLMICCNLLNWRYFLKALQNVDNTLTATVLTAAANYTISFILGSMVYQEPISFFSACGCSLIVIGLWYLCVGDVVNEPKPQSKSIQALD